MKKIFNDKHVARIIFYNKLHKIALSTTNNNNNNLEAVVQD